MQRVTALFGTCLMIFTCHAQTAFEAASVKPSLPADSGGMSGGPGSKDPTRFTSANMSLSTLVMQAYNIKRAQFSAPGWMDTERFDIVAKVPPGATREQFRLMLQNLLTERFKLALHHEEKEMPIYQLVVAKNGLKLKESAADAAPLTSAPAKGDPYAPGPDGFPVMAPGEKGIRAIMFRTRMQAPRESMEEFAADLSWTVGLLVRDATGLKGKYDFGLSYVRDGASDEESGPRLLDAIQDQLGLKLERTKGPVDTLVIDHAEKVPLEN